MRENGGKQDAFSLFNALLFPKRENVVPAKKICTIYRDDAITESKWFGLEVILI